MAGLFLRFRDGNRGIISRDDACARIIRDIIERAIETDIVRSPEMAISIWRPFRTRMIDFERKWIGGIGFQIVRNYYVDEIRWKAKPCILIA